MKNNIIHKLLDYGLREAYYIGFVEKDYLNLSKEERFKKISWLQLNGYNAGWFADPFILSIEQNKIQLLVEEYVYELDKGVISLLEIEQIQGKYLLNNVHRLLELPTHLSFPNIWRENGKIYVYPENWHSGALYMYELDLFQRKLVKPIKLVNVPLVDSAIFEYGNKYYLIGTRRVTVSNEEMKSADIFVSDSLFGPYQFQQTIHNESCIERGAGEIYKQGDSLIRPVQKCDNAYGEAVILNKLFWKDDRFIETELKIIEPDTYQKYGSCLHTLYQNGFSVQK